ncbi:MAG TPA: hypothetical protein VNI01_09120, partial [Elusimicrobiota bacterium]|nr:hypothetical protein [Elusimicrobiota bacterium]
MRARGVGRRDAAILGLLAALAALLHGPVLFGGRTYFSNDIQHVNWAWRALSAELLQKGRLPLWNPYPYFGLPLLGTMQTGVFHPPALLFELLSFPVALGWFLLANQALAAAWTYLWLRAWGAGRPGAAAA